jgi:hexosaminidase
MTGRKLQWAFMAIFACIVFSSVAIRAEESAKEAELQKLGVVPRPVSMEQTGGKPLSFDADTLVIVGRGAAKESIEQAVQTIYKATGIEPNLPPKEKTSTATILSLILNPSIGEGRPDWQAAESYTLAFAKEGSGVDIAASDAHGLFNGVQTFVQILKKGEDGEWSVPAVKIEDYPRFSWRGYLLDTARHFRPKEEVLRYLDLLAMHKMNLLHLHLVDDQGWRIEIKRYPKLTEVGARLPNYSGGKGEGWFYSQADIKEIVAYAADRHITVLPEIEMPAHSAAATTSYPELSCNGKPVTELCGSKESTYEFMANVLDEIIPLFPSPFIHIGADEVQPEHWRACPSCKKRMDELAAAKLPEGVQRFRVQVNHLAGVPFNEDVALLEGEFVRRIDKHLAEKGKRMIGWDEILDGGLQKESKAAVMAWRGNLAIGGAAEQDRDVVDTEHPLYYLDNNTSLEQTYAVEPVPAGMTEAKAKHVLGVQGNMWGESTPTQARVDQQTFPRLCAIAETGWSPKASKDFKDFSARMELHAKRLQPYGISIVIKPAQ